MTSNRDLSIAKRALIAIALIVAIAKALIFAAMPLRADDLDARTELARSLALLNAGNASGARDQAVAAVREAPKWGLAHAVHAITLVELGDGVGAEAALGRAREGGFDMARAWHLLADAQRLQGQPERALETLGRAAPRFRARSLIVRARALAALGREGESRAAFRAANLAAPRDARVWHAIAERNLALGDLGGAIEASAKAVALDPADVDALVLRARLVREQFGPVAALDWFERALERDARDHDALIEYAATLGEVGRTVDMLAAIRRAMAVQPGSPQGYYLQALLAARAEDFHTARAVLQRIGPGVEAMPGALLLSGALDLQAGGYQQAIGKLDMLVGRQPHNRDARILLAQAHLRADASRNAIQLLAPIIERDDADAQALLLAARGFERIGDRERAAILADRAAAPLRPSGRAYASDETLAANHPGAPETHLAVGDVRALEGDHAGALAAYRTAASLRFDEATMLRLVGAAEKAGRPEEAAATLALFLSQNPVNVTALRLGAKWQIASGEYEAAIAALEDVRLRIGNRDAALLAELATAYTGAGQADVARVYARAAYALAPTNAAVADAYGWAMLKAGEAQPAAVMLAKAAAIAPGHAVIRWHLAQAYAAIGRRAEAAVHARAALADPSFTDRREAEALARG